MLFPHHAKQTGNNIEIEAQCIKCRAVTPITVTVQELKAYWNGSVIQEAFSNLDCDQRELLISGICGKCFDDVFSKDEEC